MKHPPPRVHTYRGLVPRLGPRCALFGCTVVGDVVLGEDASVWFGAVVRGDVHPIRIGARSNVQDLSMVHVTDGRNATHIGDDVTIGHRAILHGCTVGDRVLVGMGATIMDRAVIGSDTIIGAGALVTPNTHIPSGVLAVGSPARVVRPLTEAERASLVVSAHHYVEIVGHYRDDEEWSHCFAPWGSKPSR